MAGLYTNQNSDSAQALSDLMMGVKDAINSEKSAVEALEKLKLNNAQKLAKMRKDQEFDIVNLYTSLHLKAAGEIHKNDVAALKKLNNQRLKDEQKLSDALFKRKYGFEKSELQKRMKQDRERIDKEFAYRKKHAEKAAKEKLEQIKKEANQNKKQGRINFGNSGYGIGTSKGLSSIIRNALTSKVVKDGKERDANAAEKGLAFFADATKALGNYVKQLDGAINEIAGRKSAIDTRLQGLNGKKWEDINEDIKLYAGTSAIVKQSALAGRVQEFVGKGIAFNVEQRAILQELSGKIATTFDAANGTLLRLVRIQQQDTTAGRLGMESALTSFLNNMYQTTEYMNSIATSIKGSLEEAMSLMTGENALSFEYQVQKWLGSMYSVGMSDNAVQGLGGVLGKLAAGQLDAITQGGQGNLVIMAANQAGLSVSDMLNNGLNAQTTNDLMNSMVDYLAKIYQEAGESKVVQQQMASIYGMTASDLKAAANLARSRGSVSRNGLTYSGAMRQLQSMSSSITERMSFGELMSNAFENFDYSMAEGIANNAGLFAVYKIANKLTDLTGGIDIGTPLVNGSGMPVAINVADVMRTAALAGSLFGGMSTLGASLSNSTNGWGMLQALGVGNGLSAVTRGSGSGLRTTGGATVSESGSLIGNSEGGDAQNAALTSATDSNNSATAAAVDSSEETKLKDVRGDIIEIYHLLQDFAAGTYTLPVEVKGTVKTEGGSGMPS